jgi:hypothetical protein
MGVTLAAEATITESRKQLGVVALAVGVRGARVMACSLLIAMTVAGCASPVTDLWPPRAGQPAHPIVVSIDVWHAVIAFPLASRASEPDAGRYPDGAGGLPDALFEEWGYAERGWYLEGRQGMGGVFRAMLGGSPGVVEVTLSDRLWAERTPDPPADTFRFLLSDAGRHRLREHLLASLASKEPVAVIGPSHFYSARADYHLFHTCHHYAAGALRVAGLPITPGLAISREALASQLRRAEAVQRGASGPSGLTAVVYSPSACKQVRRLCS